MSKQFLVIYPLEKRLRDYLDAMRLIANPLEKHPAHITVRGPYKRAPSLSIFNKNIVGSYVNVRGTGCFFEYQNQNTVFLKCESESLRSVWYKPDYEKEFNPHITIYNGSCRDLARRLLDCLKMIHFDFSFQVNGLSLLVSRKDQFPSMGLLHYFNPDIFHEITGEPLEIPRVYELTSIERVYYVGLVANKMIEYALNDKTLQFMFSRGRTAL